MNWNVPTYGFGYNGDAALQHLAGIGSNVGTAENYTFSYGTIGALVSPWGGNYGSVRTLATAGNTGIGVAHTFGYNGSWAAGGRMARWGQRELPKTG